MQNRVRRFLSISLFILLISTVTFAQTPATFTQQSSPSGIYQQRVVTGDLNNDGREDFVATSQTNSSMPGFTVQLSNGDGTYAAPQNYQFPNSAGAAAFDVVVADVNGDGKLDILVSQQTAGFHEYLNNGDGTFHLQATFVVPMALYMAVADLNHDGRPDLVYDCTLNFSTIKLCTMFGNGNNGFDPGPTTLLNVPHFPQDLFVGDFDGDAKADLAIAGGVGGYPGNSTDVMLLWGDGAGNFTPSNLNTDSGLIFYQVVDLDANGKSDLIGTPMNGPNTNQLVAYYGNSARTIDHWNIPLGSCSTGSKAAVADFNGDGIPDIALPEYGTCSAGPPYNLVIKYGNGGRTFSNEQVIYSQNMQFFQAFALRADQNTKPDLAVFQYTGATAQTNIIAFLNTTSGSSFPSCSAPVDAMEGINICSPGSSTTTTNVHFGIGAAGQTQMRKVEVWVDGTKLAEQFTHAFSHYAFMDYDTTLSAGVHTVDVYAAGFDNLLQHTSFTTNVASGTGTGGCGQPTVPGVNICSPANGSTVNSPFTISAAGRNSGPTDGMDVWLDGHKVGFYPGTSVNIQVTAAAGSHQLDIYAVGTNGELQQSTVHFTVGTTSGGGDGGGTCSQPSSPGVNICSPTSGSTVTSPFTVSASGRNSGNTEGLDVWLDGKKVGFYYGTKVDIQVSAGTGSHQLDIYAVGTNGELQEKTVVFTVGTSSGGGGGSTCSARTSPGVTICSPADGSTVSSPVQIEAYGMNSGSTDGMDVYIDGHHTGWYGGTTHLSISVALGSGSHQLDVYAVGTNGELQESTVHFNVP